MPYLLVVVKTFVVIVLLRSAAPAVFVAGFARIDDVACEEVLPVWVALHWRPISSVDGDGCSGGEGGRSR